MSWLSIPLPNPFKSLQFYDDEDDDQQQEKEDDSQNVATENDGASGGGGGGGGGVKEDLTAIGESISRQFRGVAAFLAPPPDEAASSSAAAAAGIRSDLAEIGGTFKNTLSLFSNPNNAVSQISKLASDFLQLNEEQNSENIHNDDYDEDEEYDDDDDDDEEYGSGVTDQVIEFARQISDRPELWIDFPLSLQDHDVNMSEVQCEHASIVERLVPSLADLKNRISSYKSEQQFWMIYFILLLPRLNNNGLELLSTPQIIQTRETLLMMLQAKKNEEISRENAQSHSSLELDNEVDIAEPENNHFVKDVTTIENTVAASNIGTNESKSTEKLEGMEGGSTVTSTHCDTKTDDPELSRILSSEVAKAHENLSHLTEPVPKRFLTDDDVSFSDLEEDDDNDLPNREPGSGSSQIKRNSSTEGSSDWVRLNEGVRESHDRGKAGSRDRESEGEDSTDWLTVDDFDP